MKPREYPEGDYRRSELLLSHADFEHEAEVRGYVPKAALATARAVAIAECVARVEARKPTLNPYGSYSSEREAGDRWDVLDDTAEDLRELLALPASLVAVEQHALSQALHLAWATGRRTQRKHHTEDFDRLYAVLGLPTSTGTTPAPEFVAVERETIEKLRDAVLRAAHSLTLGAIDSATREALTLLDSVKP